MGELRRAGAQLRADAVVVGSGAGGAAAAAEMAAGGMDVAVLEEGARHDHRTFTARPRDMTLRLYRHAPARALGRQLTIHPASAARARFDEPIDPWHGVPQS